MADQTCKHTLYHRDEAGRLQGTWRADATEHGARISCGDCGKFYGYEPPSTAATPEPSTSAELGELVAPKVVLASTQENPGNGATREAATYDLPRWNAYQTRLTSGEATAAEHRAEFEAMLVGKDGFLDHLKRNSNAHTLRSLAMRVGVFGARQQTKTENAEAVFRALLRSFALDRSISYSPFQGETHETAVAKIVRGLNDQDLADFVASERRNVAAKEKALNAPETLDEFQHFERRRGLDALSDEQLAAYDALQARASRAARQKARPVEVSQFAAEEMADAQLAIVEGFHEKRQCPVYIVKLPLRVERATFDELNRKAKMLSGWYSSFKRAEAGFHFLSRESAEKFVALQAGSVDRSAELTIRNERRQAATRERLEALAESRQERAEATIERSHESLQNTARRAGIQASVRDQARADQALAQTLERVAAALNRGEAEFLSDVRHGTHVETLLALLKRAHWNHAHAVRKQSADLSPTKRQVLVDVIDGREPNPSDVRFAAYPFPTVDRRRLAEAVLACRHRQGVKQSAAKLGARLKVDLAEYLEFNSDQDAALLKDFVGRAQRTGYDCEILERSFEAYDRLRRANIATLPELRAALRELIEYRQAPGVEDLVSVTERDLLGKEIPGFFPTPRPVIERMLALLDIEPGHRVLEPSCGKGDIADAIRERRPEAALTLVERNRMFAPILAAKGYEVRFEDFLDHAGKYDRILMNPPFERAAEVEHVRKAFELLAPGGALVSVMSEGPFFRGDAKSVAFREWLEQVGASYQSLPDDAFSGREAFRQTSVRTRLVCLERPICMNGVADEPIGASAVAAEAECPPLPAPPLVRPDRQIVYADAPNHYHWPDAAALHDRDTITVDRVVDDIDGPAHRFVIKRGDLVECYFGPKRLETGTVTGVSHANQEVRVSFREGSSGQWFAVGAIYPAVEDVPPGRRATSPWAKAAEPESALFDTRTKEATNHVSPSGTNAAVVAGAKRQQVLFGDADDSKKAGRPSPIRAPKKRDFPEPIVLTSRDEDNRRPPFQ